MFEGSNISRLTENEDKHLNDNRTCLALVICNPPHINCYLGKCLNCPNYSKLRRIFDTAFNNHFIEDVTYYQWTHTDRSKLEVRIENSDEFIQTFLKRLGVLIRHVFITDQQNTYIKEVKTLLRKTDILVLMDFSENYGFVVQDAVQGYHWTNEQATIHPFAIYYRNQMDEIKNESFVVISDCLKHDTIAVHLFQRRLLEFLRKKCQHFKKIIYFSDGSAAQYKNKKNFF